MKKFYSSTGSTTELPQANFRNGNHYKIIFNQIRNIQH